jgi:hypothetical protein
MRRIFDQHVAHVANGVITPELKREWDEVLLTAAHMVVIVEEHERVLERVRCAEEALDIFPEESTSEFVVATVIAGTIMKGLRR